MSQFTVLDLAAIIQVDVGQAAHLKRRLADCRIAQERNLELGGVKMLRPSGGERSGVTASNGLAWPIFCVVQTPATLRNSTRPRNFQKTAAAEVNGGYVRMVIRERHT